MTDQHDEYSVFSLLHAPLNPPRDGHIGERTYAEEWQKEMRPRNHETEPGETAFSCVMEHFPGPLLQRHATVIASIVTWFGTNCGIAFLESAKRLGETSGIEFEQRFALAWALQNQRQGFMNGGFRTLENCLRTYSDTPVVLGPMMWGSSIPELSSDDYEAAECLMFWLGHTSAGRSFITRAELLIQHERDRETAERNATWRRTIDSTVSAAKKDRLAIVLRTHPGVPTPPSWATRYKLHSRGYGKGEQSAIYLVSNIGDKYWPMSIQAVEWLP